jgi:solute carrier family 25 (mitochondrial folate transporter), member 32
METNSSIKSAISGFIGSTSFIILYPLDYVKINIVAGDGYTKNLIPRYRSAREAFFSLYRTNGVLSFYKGCHISLFSSVAWTLYFYIYDKAKNRYKNLNNTSPNLYKLLTASEAAILSRIITHPLWTIKTRLILQQNSRSWYGDTVEAIAKIWRTDGIKGYFAGLVPGLMLCSNGIFNLYFYELQKEVFEGKSSLEVGVYGMNSKMLASVFTYPIQLVMIRLQQEQYSNTILQRAKDVEIGGNREKFFSGTVNCMQKTFRNEGFFGFYRGLSLQLLRTIPGNGLFFMLYEYTSSKLSHP